MVGLLKQQAGIVLRNMHHNPFPEPAMQSLFGHGSKLLHLPGCIFIQAMNLLHGMETYLSVDYQEEVYGEW